MEVDTKEIRLRRGLVLKHFSVRDVICRWHVLEVPWPRDFAGGSSLFQYPVGTPALPSDLSTLNHQLRRWEKTYNCVRPHQSLTYLTPLEFITRWKLNLGKAKCH